MTRDQWEFVKKTGELPGAMNWNIAEQQQLAAKLEDPF
jgi:hypothetical protein